MSTVLETTSAHLQIRATTDDDALKLFLDLAWIPDESEQSDDKKSTSGQTGRPDSNILYAEVLSTLAGIIDRSRLNTAVILHAVKQLASGEEVSHRRIAKGVAPEAPHDGKLVFLVKKISNIPDLKEDDSGSVDHRQLRLFENIEAGQIVARLYPPRPGADGEDVFGRRITSEAGSDIEVKVDDSLEIKPPQAGRSYSTVLARTEGYLLQEGDTLSIRNELIVPGNIDYKTGNIDFIGSVRVLGDVLPGFIVRARKDIFVEGVLDGGRLVSTEGSVEVAKLVTATSPSHIEAANNVTLSVAQGATVRCGELLTISKEARSCNLKSYSTIDAEQAELIGGTAEVICGLNARVIGHESGVKTQIFLCSDIEMDGSYKLLLEDIGRHETALAVLKSHLGPYAERPDRVIFLREGLKEKIVSLLERFAKISKSYNSLVKRKEELLSGSRKSEIAAISFSGTLHPGVEIRSGEHKFDTPESISGPKSITYNSETGEFSVADYQAAACQFRDTTREEAAVDEQ